MDKIKNGTIRMAGHHRRNNFVCNFSPKESFDGLAFPSAVRERINALMRELLIAYDADVMESTLLLRELSEPIAMIRN